MEQKKLSHIFEEEFNKWTSLKVFWICLAVMVAGFLALCATVFYLDNGSAAKVLSGKEQLMANVWGRVFAVIAVMPVVIILFMFGFAALFGGFAVLVEKNKRKQAAILGVPQIQEQSKDNEITVQEQPVPVELEPEVQEPVVEQADTVESEETQKEEIPVAQAEESPTQPEPIAQESAIEQTETAASDVGEEGARSETEEIIETDENTETKAKRHIVRSDSHGKALPLNIDEKSFRAAFIPAFSEKIIDSDYSFLVQNLNQIYWTLTDLGKVALLIHESGVLVESYASMPFSEWMVEFFKMMGRTDCPSNPDRSAYVQFWKSRIPFQQTCSCLMRYYVKAQNNNDIEFVNPNKKKQE